MESQPIDRLITVSEKEWKQLNEDSDFLAALWAAGVDNWEGYSIACRIALGELDEDDI